MSASPGSQDTKERIRDASDIVELVGQYVKLRRVGSNWQGLCPFHHEKTPSFNVNPERQNFYCFGCHEGGDVFTFIQEMEGVSFPEALEFLGKRAGIEVEDLRRRGSGEDRKDAFYRINQSAGEFYHRILMREDSGEPARNYLKRRGLSDETLEKFSLGYAPQSWRLLHEHLGKQGFPAEKVLELGLVRSKSSGPGHYDLFRGRVIFPVKAVGGRDLGFGARVLDDSLPKYINSSDSPVYTKKGILYGLDQAWREIRRQKLAVLVEGYFDVISLHEAGIPIAVAVCGTAFTSEQARLLKRYTDQVCVVTDGDSAGLKASIKASATLLVAGIEPTVAAMDSGEDPDSSIRKEGVERFQERLRDAPHYFDFLRAFVARRGDKPEEREKAIRNVLETLTAFPDGDLHLRTLLERLSGSFDVEIPMLKRALGEIRRGPSRKFASADESSDESVEERGNPEEKALLAILLDEGQGRNAAIELLEGSDFSDPRLARIFNSLQQLGRVPSAEDLGRLFPDQGAARQVHELSFLGVSRDGAWVRPAAFRLKLSGLLERNRDFQGRVEALELAGEKVPADLLEEWRHLGERIRTLREDLDRSLGKKGA
jgi:DNA primase